MVGKKINNDNGVPVDEVIWGLDTKGFVELDDKSKDKFIKVIDELKTLQEAAASKTFLTGESYEATFQKLALNKFGGPSIGYEIEFKLKPKKFVDDSFLKVINQGYLKSLIESHNARSSNELVKSFIYSNFNSLKNLNLINAGINLRGKDAVKHFHLECGSRGINPSFDITPKNYFNTMVQLLSFLAFFAYPRKNFIKSTSLEELANEVQTKLSSIDINSWSNNEVIINSLNEIKKVYSHYFTDKFFDYFELRILSIHCHINIEFTKELKLGFTDLNFIKWFLTSNYYLPLCLMASYKINKGVKGSTLSLRLDSYKKELFDVKSPFGRSDIIFDMPLKGSKEDKLYKQQLLLFLIEGLKLPNFNEFKDERGAYRNVFNGDFEVVFDNDYNYMFIRPNNIEEALTFEDRLIDGSFDGALPSLHPIITFSVLLYVIKFYRGLISSNKNVNGALKKHLIKPDDISKLLNSALRGSRPLNNKERDSIIKFYNHVMEGIDYGVKLGYLNYPSGSESNINDFKNGLKSYYVYKLLLLGYIYLTNSSRRFLDYIKFIYRHFKGDILSLLDLIVSNESVLKSWIIKPEVKDRLSARLKFVSEYVELGGLDWVIDLREPDFDVKFLKSFEIFIKWLVVYFEFTFKNQFVG